MKEINNIFVVGSGFMGSGIAQVAAVAGYSVILYDIAEDITKKAFAGIEKNLSKSVSKGRMTQENAATALQNITLSVSLEDSAEADMVIEAAPEREDLKKNIFRQLSDICREDTVFASNTSSISIAELSSIVKNPSRFVGTHFFSPVPVMELLEVVKGLATSQETVDIAVQVGTKMGKKAIQVKDSPAFVINRMLVPMMNEAVSLLEAGVATVEDIDAGVRLGLHHPMGPLELIDMAGLDTALPALETIFRETGDPKYRPCQLFLDMRRMGWLGRKTGIGFYVYHEDGSRKPNPNL